MPTGTEKGMRFASVLKGRLAERIVVTLLERAGFRVSRLGIEELMDEVKYLDLAEYKRLDLPPRLRTLPDLLVASSDVSWAAMVEVKYRRTFDVEAVRTLYDALRKQQEFWPEAWALILVGEPPSPGRFHQDYIRVIPPGEIELLRDIPDQPMRGSPPFEGVPDEKQRTEWLWNSLPMMTRLFDFDYESDESMRFWKNADFVTSAIKQLPKI